MNNLSETLRWLFAAVGAITAILAPTLPYLIICTLMIFADCFTAWQLSKRARKAHPERVSKDGRKFKSQHFGLPIDLTKVAAGAICFWQLWSILENESSCNGARWAKLLQRIVVDKTERHFDIDLSEMKTKTTE